MNQEQQHGITFLEIYFIGMLFTMGCLRVTVEESLSVLQYSLAYLFWPITLGVLIGS